MFRATYRLISNKRGKHRARVYRCARMKFRFSGRKRINICTIRVRRRAHVLENREAAACEKKACSAHLRDPPSGLSSRKFVLAINQRVETAESSPPSIILPPRFSRTVPRPFLSLSLSLAIFLFFLAQRGSLVDAVLTRQPRSVRQFTPATILPASLVFLSPLFFLPFFLARHRKRQREHKPPTRATEFTPANGRAKCVRLARPSLICHGDSRR